MKTGKWCTVIALGMLIAGCKKEPANEPAPAPVAKVETPAPTPNSATSGETKPATDVKAAPASTPAPIGNLLKPATLKVKAPDTYRVKFVTTRGEFTILVTRSWAPLEADRFYNLVRAGFYDDTPFFRVVPGFVVQFGISGKPAVSAAWRHEEMQDDPVTTTNKRGTITFAQTGKPNSRTTQVFINLADNGRLDSTGQGFAPFGIVEGNGMNVVEMLYDGYGNDGGPDQDLMEKQGNAYVKKGWPKLDYTKTATIISTGDAAPAKKVQ
jgi:peptidyl-prolyl cis-trans isomerase A (cyclophilin A)